MSFQTEGILADSCAWFFRMSELKYDVAVAYRIYPRVSKVPAVHPDDKLRLARLCLQSFRASLGKLRAKVYVLLDACPCEFEALFTEAFDVSDLEFIRLPGIGNLSTFSRQIDLLLGQKDAEAVYFAEDDYFYLPGQFEQMLDFLHSFPDADFVSAYDHPDVYHVPLHQGAQQIRLHRGRHWRTCGSTCLTFLSTRRTLAASQRAFRTYARRNLDVSIWLALTKQVVVNPARILRSARKCPALTGYVAMSWLRCWPQILFGRRRKLWTPIPAIATHMEKERLAPGIDWQAQFRALATKIETAR